jgi:hypothetical protein
MTPAETPSKITRFAGKNRNTLAIAAEPTPIFRNEALIFGAQVAPL